MSAFSTTGPWLQKPDRRSFLWSLAGLGVTTKTRNSEKPGKSLYRLLTPECEVRMTVQYFAKPLTNSFRFRDEQTDGRFCLSADGAKDKACVDRFVGSMAIAHYDFRSRLHSKTPLNLRERVLTIDYDSRLSPRPPFERMLAIEGTVVSDIQAFGYNSDDPQHEPPGGGPLAVWCLLRQDLYLNDQSAAFLIVHWKHTLDFISLLDVIPGDGTELIWEGS